MPSSRASPPTGGALQRDGVPDFGVDGAAGDRSLPGGDGAAVPGAGPGQDLRGAVPAGDRGPWHRGGRDGGEVAVAEPVRAAAHRFASPGLSGSRDRAGRGAPPADPGEVLRVLQRDPLPSVSGRRCPGASGRPGAGVGRGGRVPGSGGTPPSVRAGRGTTTRSAGGPVRSEARTDGVVGNDRLVELHGGAISA